MCVLLSLTRSNILQSGWLYSCEHTCVPIGPTQPQPSLVPRLDSSLRKSLGMRLAPASMTILMWAHSYTCVFHSPSPMRNMHYFKGIIKFLLLKLLSVKDCEGWWLSGGCIRARAAQDWSCGFGLLAGGVREGRMRRVWGRVWGREVGRWGGPCKSCLVCVYNLKSRKLTGYPVYKNWEVPLSFCL